MSQIKVVLSNCDAKRDHNYRLGADSFTITTREYAALREAVLVSEEMVSRFLAWKLPQDFSPDCGISFDGRKPDQWNKDKGWPIGTNLLTATQAREMLEYVLGVGDSRTLRSATGLRDETQCAIPPTIEDSAERYRKYGTLLPLGERPKETDAEIHDGALRSSVEGMAGSAMYATERPCGGCGKPLLIENAWMEDGCPCNTPAGVNNLNLYRWHLLHQLQQRQSRELEAKQAEIDRLMLEFCPDEMSEAQKENWARHQRPVSAEESAAIDRAARPTIGERE